MPFDASKQKRAVGRPLKSTILETDKLTNRELREKQLLSLARRFKPEVPKALKLMIDLLSATVFPATRLNAAKFIIDFHTEIVRALYKEKYDSDQGEAFQQQHRIRIIDASNIAEFKPVIEPIDALLAGTNRVLREKQLLTLGRKIKPHVTLAIQTINAIIADIDTPKPVQFAASKYMIIFSKTLTENLYQDLYDFEATKVKEDSTPMFSLRVVENK